MKVSEISLHKAPPPPELKQTRHARHIYLSRGGEEDIDKHIFPKAHNDFKQKCAQFLMAFFGAAFYSLSHDAIRFIPSVSPRNRFVTCDFVMCERALK